MFFSVDLNRCVCNASFIIWMSYLRFPPQTCNIGISSNLAVSFSYPSKDKSPNAIAQPNSLPIIDILSLDFLLDSQASFQSPTPRGAILASASYLGAELLRHWRRNPSLSSPKVRCGQAPLHNGARGLVDNKHFLGRIGRPEAGTLAGLIIHFTLGSLVVRVPRALCEGGVKVYIVGRREPELAWRCFCFCRCRAMAIWGRKLLGEEVGQSCWRGLCEFKA